MVITDHEFHERMAEVSAFLAWYSDDEIERMFADEKPALVDVAKRLRSKRSVLVNAGEALDLLHWVSVNRGSTRGA